MSMGSGGTGNAVSEINVTPLIDVLLVLLIIFMVIVPATPRGLDAVIPQPAKDEAIQPSAPIVVEVQSRAGAEPIYRINEAQFAKQELESKLAAIFVVRERKVMFVKADAGLEFSKVAEVVNMGHRANVQDIGLMTMRENPGQ